MSNYTYDSVEARGLPPVAAYPDIACRGVDTEVFFPGSGEEPRLALKLCAVCPHRQPCLDWALTTRQGFGVWGGTTAADRKRIHERRDARARR